MEMSLFQKIGLVFKYMFSSFVTVEMLILSLLLLFILIYNMKVNNKYVNLAAIGTYIGFMLGIIISYRDYVVLCINSFVKTILTYIYFPSTFVYFLTFVFITILMIRTIFNKKISKVKKIANYICFTVLYFLFMSFIVLCVYTGVDIYNTVLLYQDATILAIVQVSNLFFGCWLIFTFFYELYCYFKRKYD